MSLSNDAIKTRDDAFTKMKFSLSGLNIVDRDSKRFFVMGMAETDSDGPDALWASEGTYAIGAAAKDSEGHVVGIGDTSISICHTGVAAFEICIWPRCGDVTDVASVELYPFTKRAVELTG